MREIVSAKASSNRLMPVLLLHVAFFCTSATLCAQEGHLRELREKTEKELERIASQAEGVIGYVIQDLEGNHRFQRKANWVFPQGSAIKVPVLMEVYKQARDGRFELSERITLTAAAQVGGSGVLYQLGDGTSALSVRDLAVLMILVSDNTATNLLIDRVGMANVNQTMKDLGLENTKVRRLMMDTDARARGDENISTPAEAARLMEMLFRRKFLSEEDDDDILSILRKPKSGAIRAGLPDGVPISFKPGGIPGVATEWAIVHLEKRPYVVVIMGNYGRNDGLRQAMTEISKIAYDYFWKLSRSSRYGTYVGR